jgi:hypothetical protein
VGHGVRGTVSGCPGLNSEPRGVARAVKILELESERWDVRCICSALHVLNLELGLLDPVLTFCFARQVSLTALSG